MAHFCHWRHISIIPLLAIWATCAYGQHWGNFKKDNCTKPGYRQYSAVLEGIPFGQSWEKACASKDATIAGHYFPKPNRCRNQGPGIAMWGEFDVPDNSCKAQWGSFQRGACTTIGKRKYSAQVLNVPPGQTWENACATTPANVQGQSFATPSKCSNTGVTGEWGEFDVNDNTCQAHWGNFQRGECTTTGKREYSAQLSVPDGLSWEATCATTPATVAGQSFRSPTRCEKRLAGVGGEWGTFDVNDTGCEVHLLPNQWPNPNPNPNAPIWGFADTHNHMFAHLGFGGLFVWGKTFDPRGIAAALPWCDCLEVKRPGVAGLLGTHTVLGCPPNAPNQIHGAGGVGDHLGDLLTAAEGVKNSVGHLVGGYPQFDGWPRWDTVSHQLEYYQWLKRAHAGGLQLMVMMAVNNEFVCSLMKSPLGCDDMSAVDRQLAAAKELESFIAANDGGWYRIVRSPAEARQAIHKGQLAVVLGIEVANLFGCARVPNRCTNDEQGRQYVRNQLQKYYDAGVRHLFPIHATDNAFAGTAIFEDVYLLNNIYFGREPFVTDDCYSTPPTDPNERVNFYLGSTIADPSIKPLWELLRRAVPGKLPPYQPKGQCNRKGLSPLGEFLVQEMMSRHMIIDVDHMSWKAINDTLTIAEKNPQYPVISGHSGYIETSTGQKKHEGQKNASQLTRIFNLRGMAGVITAQGVTEQAGSDGVGGWPPSPKVPKVPNDCSNSSKTFAQAYLFAVDTMGGPQKARVALATDLMGAIYQPGPRYGNDACYGAKKDNHGNNVEKPLQDNNKRVKYPFTLPGATVALYPSRACDGRDFSAATKDCTKTFDFNVDGLAHAGMLPDFIQDLRGIGGLSDTDLAPLFRSAEAYIQMWEKAERARP